MIEAYSNETQTRWGRGEFRVMIQAHGSDRPIGFCDGSEADEAEIRETAEQEGTEVTIEKRALKTGREVWTVKAVGERDEEPYDGM